MTITARTTFVSERTTVTWSTTEGGASVWHQYNFPTTVSGPATWTREVPMSQTQELLVSIAEYPPAVTPPDASDPAYSTWTPPPVPTVTCSLRVNGKEIASDSFTLPRSGAYGWHADCMMPGGHGVVEPNREWPQGMPTP